MDNTLFTKSIIDKDSGVPLYYQLYLYIIDLINTGRLNEGDQLPTEEELCELLDISRPTVRQAYNKLVNDRLVKRDRGKGSVVQKTQVFKNFLNKVTTFYDEVDSKSEQVKTKVVKLEVTEDCEEAKQELKANKLVHLGRIRYIDQKPVVYLDSYVSYEKYKNLLTYDFENQSLYKSMEELTGERVSKVRRTITAIKANRKIAEYLAIQPGDPVILSITYGMNEKGEVLEYSIAQYNAAITSFEININQ